MGDAPLFETAAANAAWYEDALRAIVAQCRAFCPFTGEDCQLADHRIARLALEGKPWDASSL
jgi:hypothetical protein